MAACRLSSLSLCHERDCDKHRALVLGADVNEFVAVAQIVIDLFVQLEVAEVADGLVAMWACPAAVATQLYNFFAAGDVEFGHVRSFPI
jgi:hypothetical protein